MGEQQVTQKELPYFDLEGAYGGWQVWFADRWMKIGGCAAVTACDVSIYHGLSLLRRPVLRQGRDLRQLALAGLPPALADGLYAQGRARAAAGLRKR